MNIKEKIGTGIMKPKNIDDLPYGHVMLPYESKGDKMFLPENMREVEHIAVEDLKQLARSRCKELQNGTVKNMSKRIAEGYENIYEVRLTIKELIRIFNLKEDD